MVHNTIITSNIKFSESEYKVWNNHNKHEHNQVCHFFCLRLSGAKSLWMAVTIVPVSTWRQNKHISWLILINQVQLPTTCPYTPHTHTHARTHTHTQTTHTHTHTTHAHSQQWSNPPSVVPTYLWLLERVAVEFTTLFSYERKVVPVNGKAKNKQLSHVLKPLEKSLSGTVHAKTSTAELEENPSEWAHT